ncbi:MAG: NAD(P)-dependent oxidoreductase [Propionibacteriaceae bacterium]|nr:NAD(P)-dependent oxidoreductase [Propionibacteriaceae bacterium]
MTMDVSLCGLGPMGLPIARRLLAAGIDLTVWNRTTAKAQALASEGARLASTPADAATQIVLTVLPDLPQVQDVVERPGGLADGWTARGVTAPVLVVHGTVSPRDVKAYATDLAQAHHVTVIDAPLSGGTVGAAAGTLSIMVGGDRRVADTLQPLFENYARTIKYFGHSGSGALAKACNQVVVASTVAAISEALALASRAGIDPVLLVEVLQGGLASSEVLRQKRDKWLSRDFTEGGSARNQLKDLRFALAAAADNDLSMSVTDAVRGIFERMVADGDGDLDHTGAILAIERTPRTTSGES